MFSEKNYHTAGTFRDGRDNKSTDMSCRGRVHIRELIAKRRQLGFLGGQVIQILGFGQRRQTELGEIISAIGVC